MFEGMGDYNVWLEEPEAWLKKECEDGTTGAERLYMCLRLVNRSLSCFKAQQMRNRSDLLEKDMQARFPPSVEVILQRLTSTTACIGISSLWSSQVGGTNAVQSPAYAGHFQVQEGIGQEEGQR